MKACLFIPSAPSLPPVTPVPPPAESPREATNARRTPPPVAAFLLAAGHVAAQQSLPRFTEVVRDNFSLWDLDGDGTLSLDEIDSWASRADLAGHQAAAMATIKAVARSTRWTLPPLTHEYLVDGIEPTQADADDSDAAFDGSAGPASGRPPFESRFRRAADRIRTTPRALFAREEPSLASLRQGPLGSCFLIAPVGAFVARDPALTYRLFIQHQDGAASMRIRSADQSLLVRIDPITDADIALSSTSGRDGAWMPAVEPGALRALRRPKTSAPSPTDVIRVAGLPAQSSKPHHTADASPSRPVAPQPSRLSPPLQEALSAAFIRHSPTPPPIRASSSFQRPPKSPRPACPAAMPTPSSRTTPTPTPPHSGTRTATPSPPKVSRALNTATTREGAASMSPSQTCSPSSAARGSKPTSPSARRPAAPHRRRQLP